MITITLDQGPLAQAKLEFRPSSEATTPHGFIMEEAKNLINARLKEAKDAAASVKDATAATSAPTSAGQAPVQTPEVPVVETAPTPVVLSFSRNEISSTPSAPAPVSQPSSENSDPESPASVESLA